MSKAGNNYYYLQDELGSPMYLNGTDGVAVSSYAFDDFGRNIDTRTGKQKKHSYTTDGNIIQPFAFTGYQEDEVSGLKFPQIIIGAAVGELIGAGVDAISQGVAIAKGEQESFNWGELAGATVEGVVVGSVASTGVGAGLAGAMLTGGLGAAAGNVTTQLINTGSVDVGQLTIATGAGIVGGGLGYGIGKAVSKVVPKAVNKMGSFINKRHVVTTGVSANTANPKQCKLAMNLQFFAEESGECPFEGGGAGKIWNYSKQFDTELANFNKGYNINNVVDKDLYLVQFHSNAEVGIGRSLKYWTTFDEANGISTIDNYMDKMALLSDWGVRDNVSIAKVPAGTEIKHAVGTARQQVSTLESRPGGGLQILFEKFDDSWVLDTRPLP